MVIIMKQFLPVIIFASLFTTPVEATTTTLDLGKDTRECVIYARSRVPSLPFGLTTWASKKKIINSQNCIAGSVAIIDTTAYDAVGHVAVVEGCNSTKTTGAIRITETNFSRGRKTERRTSTNTIANAAKELKIIGYYKK
jgi:hypothetical protein